MPRNPSFILLGSICIVEKKTAGLGPAQETTSVILWFR